MWLALKGWSSSSFATPSEAPGGLITAYGRTPGHKNRRASAAKLAHEQSRPLRAMVGDAASNKWSLAMTYTTTNEVRDTMIIKVAAKIAKQEPPQELTLEAAQKLLPPGFDLDETEWNGILSNFAQPAGYEGDRAELKHAADGGVLAHQPGAIGRAVPVDTTRPEADAKSLKNIEAPRANGAAPPHVDPPKAALNLNFDQTVERLREVQRQLAEHRQRVMMFTRVHQEKKAALARAIEAWQSGAAVSDPEQRRMAVVRDHLAAAQSDRAQRMEDLPPELRGRYGPAAAFVRKQRSVPSGVNPDALRKGQSRGAAPAAMRVLPGVGGVK